MICVSDHSKQPSCFFLICATLHPHLRDMKYESWSVIHDDTCTFIFTGVSFSDGKSWSFNSYLVKRLPYRVSVSIQLHVAYFIQECCVSRGGHLLRHGQVPMRFFIFGTITRSIPRWRKWVFSQGGLIVPNNWSPHSSSGFPPTGVKWQLLGINWSYLQTSPPIAMIPMDWQSFSDPFNL